MAGAHPIAAPLSSHRGPRLFASLGSPHHGTASEQLRIICTLCVVCEPGGACHARPSARVSSTGLETQGPEASLLLLQRNLVLRAAPLRSAPELLLVWLFFLPTEGEKLAPSD